MASKEDYLKFMSEVRKVSGVDTLTPDGTELERDDTVYDKLAAFVTHGAKATLAALDEREKKVRYHSLKVRKMNFSRECILCSYSSCFSVN